MLPAAILLRGILTCAFFGVDAFVSLTLVGWRGLSATQAGIALTAATIAWTAGPWIQARGAEPLADAAVRPGGVRGHHQRAGRGCSSSCGRTSRGGRRRRRSAWPASGMGLAYSPLALIVLREAPPENQGAAIELAVADRFARDRARHRA